MFNYMYLVSTFVLFLSLGCSATKAQDYSEYITRYETVYELDQFLRSYTYTLEIKNKGDQYILFWVDDDDISSLDSYGKIRRFFFDEMGDYNLYNLISEDLLDEMELTIGHSFFSLILPSDIFRVHLNFEEEVSANKTEEQVNSWIAKHLVIMTKQSVDKVISIPLEKIPKLSSNDLVIRF